MYQFIIQLKCDYLFNISLKENVVTDEGTGQNEGWTHNKEMKLE